MSCFPCFSSQRSKSLSLKEPPVARAIGPHDASSPHPAGHGNPNSSSEGNGTESNSKTFTFRELAAATKNFRQECLLGEGGFGRVYKGTLQATGQVVAVKQLDRNGMHGNKEFLVEVMMLSLLHHPNLVNLIGYCADGDQRLLVYEYLPFGSLDDHLLDLGDGKKPLDWPSRMKIASGAAQGLEYLHEKANPPVIYRDLKSSNILLDQDYNPRLSDFGLAKLGLDGGKMHVSPRVMGTYGYCAPEYERTGELTLKSDVYSFGVILLELLTGRRAVDTSRPTEEQNLVSWAQPYFRDPKRFPELADPNLNSKFPVKSLNQAVGVCAMCLQEEPAVRPLIGDVVTILSFLTMGNEEIPSSPKAAPTQDHSDRKSASDDGSRRSDSSGEEEEDEDSDQEDEQSFESSDSDDDDDEGQSETSADNNKQEETNPEKPPEKVKKSVKWASRCRSKGGNSGNTSVISRSTSKNSDNDDKSAASGQNLESKSSVKLHSNSIQDKGTSKGDFEPLGSKKLSQVGSSSANSKNSSKGDLEPVGSKKMSQVGSSSAKSNNSMSSSSTESTEGSFMTQDSIPKSNGEVESSKSNSLKLKKVASRDESSDSSSSESSDDESSRGGSIERSSSRSSSYVGSSKYQGFSPVSRRDSSRGSYYGESAASFDTRSYSSSSSSDSDSEPEQEEDQNAGGHDQIRRCRTTNVTSKSKAKVGLTSKSTNYTGSEDIRNVNTSSWKSKDRDS